MRAKLFKSYVITAFLALVTGPLASAADLREQIGELVRALEKTPQTGVSVAIVRGDELLLAAGYGLRDREHGLPVTEHTLFQTASVTKPFTSLAVGMLVDRGLLSWEAPISSYWPAFHMSDPRADAELNLIDLLSQRTGMPAHNALWSWTQLPIDELVQRFRFLGSNPKPGMGFREGFQYNNLMFAAAAHLVEVRTRRSFGEFARHEIFLPNGMLESNLSLDTFLASPDHASPYHGPRRLEYLPTASVTGAAGLNSNAIDLGCWLSFQLRGARDRSGRPLVSPQTLAMLRQERTIINDKPRQAYGLGWFLEEHPEGPWIYHPGSWRGFASQMMFLPRENLGIAVLINDGDDEGLTFALADRILALLRGQPVPPPPARPQPGLAVASLHPMPSPLAAPLTPAPSAYTGTFFDPGYGPMSVVLEGGMLRVRYYHKPLSIRLLDEKRFMLEIGTGEDAWEMPGEFVFKAGRMVGIKLPIESETAPVVFQRLLF